MTSNDKRPNDDDLDLSMSFVDLDLDDMDSGKDTPSSKPLSDKTRVTTKHTLIGRRLGSIVIQEKLGRGGMGDLYIGHETGLDIEVAVKVLAEHHARDPSQVKRFQLEAQAIARLEHPNIVRVQSVDYQLGLHYIVMEFIRGRDVATMLEQDGALPADTAALIAYKVSDALEYAHGRGIIHRDIKPGNILVSDDLATIKVIDFGLAKIAARTTRLTVTGAMLGTPHYMSPEQAIGGHVDFAADVYALGISLYEMLTGSLPFDGGSAYTIIAMHARESMAFPEEAFASVPEVFIDLIKGMCAKKAEERLGLKSIKTFLEAFLDDDERGLAIAKAEVLEAIEAASVSAVDEEEPRTNLGTETSTFVGRANDQVRLTELLVNKGERLVTMHGPGGTGKTRLAQHWGLQQVSNFPAGVWFADLSDAATRHGLCLAVASSLGISLREDHPIDQIAAALAGRCKTASGPLLLIIDNAEQVATEVALAVSRWRDADKRVHLLVTSREAIGVSGEKLYPLSPLSTPPSSADSIVHRKVLGEQDDHETYESIELFSARVHELRPDFKTDEDGNEAIAMICARLDGIPLAIELAASRCALMGPRALAERLEGNFDLLRTNRRDLPRRQATLRGAIDWSWTLLNKYERHACEQLSVFAGSFSLEAAEEVVSLEAVTEVGEGAPLAIDVISSLVEKSLVRSQNVSALSGETRFSMFKSIRAYMDEKLRENQSGDARELLLKRHAAHYLKSSELLCARIHSQAGVNVVTRLLLDQRNIRAAQSAMLARRNPASAGRMGIALSEALRIRGPWALRLPVLQPSLDALKELSSEDMTGLPRFQHIALMAELHACAAEAAADISEPARADLLSNVAEREARRLREESAVSSSEARAVLVRALLVRSQALRATNNHNSALTYAEEALGYCRADELPVHRIRSLLACASGSLLDGRLDESLRHYEEAADLARDHGTMVLLVAAVSGRADVRFTVGSFEAALEGYNEAGRLAKSLSDALGEARAGAGAGRCLNGLREHTDALTRLRSAERVARELGNREELATILSHTGTTFAALERFEEGIAAFDEAESLAKSRGDKRQLTSILGDHASLLHQLEESKQAIRLLEQAENLAREIKLVASLSEHLSLRGRILLETGQPQLALPALNEAMELLRSSGMAESRTGIFCLSAAAQAHATLADEHPAEHHRDSARVAARETIKTSKVLKLKNDLEVEAAVTKASEVLNQIEEE